MKFTFRVSAILAKASSSGSAAAISAKNITSMPVEARTVRFDWPSAVIIEAPNAEAAIRWWNRNRHVDILNELTRQLKADEYIAAIHEQAVRYIAQSIASKPGLSKSAAALESESAAALAKAINSALRAFG